MKLALVYEISVWLHLLAAMLWIGGMLFLVVAVVPVLRRGDRAVATALLHATGVRFRAAGWTCFAILVATGSVNLWFRGVRLHSLVDATFWAAPFGRALAWKLACFAVVLALSAWHDFSVGPAATRAAPGSPAAARLRRTASWMGRLNLLLAFAIVFFAVVLVRGWP